MGNNTCWYCGEDSLVCYDEVFEEGEGIVSFLTCANCKAEVQYSLKVDEE